MIKEQLPTIFEGVLPTDIILRKANDSWQDLSTQLNQFKRGEFTGCDEMFPDKLISNYFSSQTCNDKIHILVIVEREEK
jgi:hypothetical protein